MCLAIIVLAALVAALAAGMVFLIVGATATTVLSVGGRRPGVTVLGRDDQRDEPRRADRLNRPPGGCADVMLARALGLMTGGGCRGSGIADRGRVGGEGVDGGPGVG
jgi:hypothetical protein